jgi:hypothetical protein
MVLYSCDLFFGLSPSSPCFSTTTFRGMALPSSSGVPTLVRPVNGSSLYRWTNSEAHAKSPYDNVCRTCVYLKTCN